MTAPENAHDDPHELTATATPEEVLAAVKADGVIPDVIKREPELKGVLEIAYPDVSIVANGTPHFDQVQTEPEIRFFPPDALDEDARYTIIMTDPDLPDPVNPSHAQLRHWICPGLRIIPETGVLEKTSVAHTNYLAPAPMPMTGSHRYIFLLCKEGWKEVGVGERGGSADFRERLGFVAQRFISETGVEVVGVAEMKVEPTLQAGVENLKLAGESAVHVVTG